MSRYVPGRGVLENIVRVVSDPDFEIKARTGKNVEAKGSFPVWRCSCGYILADHGEAELHKGWGHTVYSDEMAVEIKVSFKGVEVKGVEEGC